MPKRCRLRVKCLDDHVKVLIKHLYEDSSSCEIDCQVSMYLSCNFDPFEYITSSTHTHNSHSQHKRDTRLLSLNKFLNKINFKWYDHDNVLIRNYLQPTYYMIKRDDTNHSSIILANRLLSYRPTRYGNLTCTVQIESTDHSSDTYTSSWMSLINSALNSASTSFSRLVQENSNYIRFDPTMDEQHEHEFVDCQVQLVSSEFTRAESIWILVVVTLLIFFVINSYWLQARKIFFTSSKTFLF